MSRGGATWPGSPPIFLAVLWSTGPEAQRPPYEMAEIEISPLWPQSGSHFAVIYARRESPP